MLENLESLIRDNAQASVVNNDQVPNEKNEQVIQAASSSVVDVLNNQGGTGGIGDMISSFTNGSAQNGVIDKVMATFADKLGGLGISAETAKSIGSSLIPMVMTKFFNKAADPNDNDFNLQEMIGKFAGGADGKFDLNDVKGMFGGDAKDGDQKGGLTDKLKGLF